MTPRQLDRLLAEHPEPAPTPATIDPACAWDDDVPWWVVEYRLDDLRDALAEARWAD